MIISPKDKKEFVFTERDVLKRFFADNRREFLEDVKNSENTKNAAE